jgi:hypothetical protein
VPVVGASNTITNLCAGNHTVDIRDANGCIIPSNFTIDEPTPITTISSGTDLSCFGVCNGTATTNPAGGTSPYDFSWNTTPAPSPTQSVNNLCAGIYIVTITDDSLCTLSDTVTIIEPVQLNPNTIIPIMVQQQLYQLAERQVILLFGIQFLLGLQYLVIQFRD